MTYHFAVYVGSLVMLRTKTRPFAVKRALRWTNAEIREEEFKGGK